MPRTFRMSEAHMAAFSEQQRQRFEDEMVVYLTREYPADAARKGEPWLRELIREGIEVAKGYNITLECDVARYIELMIAVAPDFDDSPATPWAEGILTEPWLTGAEKLDRIYEHVMFDRPGGETPDAEPPVPRPLDSDIAEEAYERLWSSCPELNRRRLTKDLRDYAYRRQWMAAYRGVEAAR